MIGLFKSVVLEVMKEIDLFGWNMEHSECGDLPLAFSSAFSLSTLKL